MPPHQGAVFGSPISKQLWTRVQAHGGASNSNILLWFPEHLRKKTRDSYPDS